MPNRSVLKALVAFAALPLAAACASGGNTAAAGGPAAAAAPTSPAIVAAGQALFSTRCQGCHGAAGVGTARGANLADDQWLWVTATTGQARRTQLEGVIRDGVPMPKQFMNAMPPVGAQMTPEQLQSLAAYIETL